MKKLRIGFIGNFRPPFSTENDRRWSFNVLGHDVVAFQEDQIDADTLLDYSYKLDLLVYSHTHGWEIEGLDEVFDYYKKAKIPTASVHLDRWAWLDREKDVGVEATWRTEYLFMADFSPEARSLYLNAMEGRDYKIFYLAPGVVARDCYMAAPDPVNYPHEIVFVGSSKYHKEYPYREELVEWLHKTYGERFGLYGGNKPIRGHQLNVLMASAKIVVGDSCFGGRPQYVSDRYYETRGRGGFLIHPWTGGIDNQGVADYSRGNLDALKIAIDHYLAHPNLRQKLQYTGFTWVKNHETYTHRAQQMLEIIFGEK